MSDDKTKPIHPGEVLLEVYMKPSYSGLTVETLSKTLRLPQQLVTGLIDGHRSITPSLASRLGVICRTTPDYWIGLQRSYDNHIGKKRGSRQPRGKMTGNSHSAAAA